MCRQADFVIKKMSFWSIYQFDKWNVNSDFDIFTESKKKQKKNVDDRHTQAYVP